MGSGTLNDFVANPKDLFYLLPTGCFCVNVAESLSLILVLKHIIIFTSLLVTVKL